MLRFRFRLDWFVLKPVTFGFVWSLPFFLKPVATLFFQFETWHFRFFLKPVVFFERGSVTFTFTFDLRIIFSGRRTAPIFHIDFHIRPSNNNVCTTYLGGGGFE